MYIANAVSILKRKPQAVARIKGSADYPDINGLVYFYQTKTGTIVAVQASGLPTDDNVCKKPIFAFHIHAGNSCSGNKSDYFSNAETHYNPNNCSHPYHAGDMPPLFGVNGYAFSVFLTDGFRVNEIIGKVVIIHSQPDDFTSQPSGNSGVKIACGQITRYR